MNSHPRSKGTHLPLLTVLAATIALTGCSVIASSGSTTPSTTPYIPTGLSGNWQIQSGTSLTPTPTPTSKTPVFLTGALQVQGSQVTGTFNTVALCTTQPVFNYTGTFDSSTGALTLATTPLANVVSLQLAVPTNPTTVAVGTIGIAGEICALVLGPGPAVGVEIASVTGTFAGTVTASSSASPISSGTVSLTLAQSAAPNSSSQFPLAGTLTFTSGSCSNTTPVSGSISGLGLTLSSSSTPVPGQDNVTLAGATNPTASQLSATGIVFSPSLCSTPASSSTTFTGTLTRQ